MPIFYGQEGKVDSLMELGWLCNRCKAVWGRVQEATSIKSGREGEA